MLDSATVMCINDCLKFSIYADFYISQRSATDVSYNTSCLTPQFCKVCSGCMVYSAELVTGRQTAKLPYSFPFMDISSIKVMQRSICYLTHKFFYEKVSHHYILGRFQWLMEVDNPTVEETHLPLWWWEGVAHRHSLQLNVNRKKRLCYRLKIV